MNRNRLIVILIGICLCPLTVNAVTFDDMLGHGPNKTQPFWGNHYKNIEWIAHTPNPVVPDAEPSGGEADYRGQIDIGLVDLQGDGKKETIKVIWGPGVSDHSLTIELYRDSDIKELISRLEPDGIQPNFKVEDIDNDGKLEIVLWGAVANPKMSQDLSDTSKPFEGHSDQHLFKVDVYKLDKDKYNLQRSYVSKQKYEPFCEEQPE